MGLINNLTRLARNSGAIRDKAAQVATEHGDKIERGIDKAAGTADERTGGKHQGRIDQGAGKAKDALRKLAGEDPEPGAAPGRTAGDPDGPRDEGPRSDPPPAPPPPA